MEYLQKNGKKWRPAFGHCEKDYWSTCQCQDTRRELHSNLHTGRHARNMCYHVCLSLNDTDGKIALNELIPVFKIDTHRRYWDIDRPGICLKGWLKQREIIKKSRLS